MLKRNLYIAISLLLGLSAPAAAETYYVAPLGAKISATPDGSLQKPYPSLSAAFGSGKVDGGETLLLMDGNHGPILLRYVAMPSPVTIRSQNGKNAHVDSIRLTDTTKNLVLQNLSVWPSDPSLNTANLVHIAKSVSNITIEGFLIRSHPDAENYLQWDEASWNARKLSGIRANGSNILLRNNRIVATYSGITLTGSSSRAEYNIVDGFNGDGMRGLGANNVFRGNRVVNCVDTDTNHDDGFQSWTNDTAQPTGLVLDSNVIHEWVATPTNHPLRCKLQGIGLFDGVYKNLTITNNIVSSTQYHGISVYGVDGGIITNNTVVHSTGNPSTSPHIMVSSSKRGVAPTNVLVANNVAMRILGTPDAVRNVIFKSNSTLTYPAEMLRDVLAFDYRPKVDSGLIDTGDQASAPKVDAVGTARPLGAGVDRGAYEGATGVLAPTSTTTTTTTATSEDGTTAKFVTAP